MKAFAAIWIAISVFATPAAAAECRDVLFEGQSFTVCEADPSKEIVRLFLNDQDGRVIGSFGNVENHIAPRKLAWAMNGGMYHSDRRPVGHYVESGSAIAPLVTREGPGNFGLLPNGVLCISRGAKVWETMHFAREKPNCDYATQSGPMLVIDGDLHPRFIENSDSLKIRNGVGVTAEGRMLGVISNAPVNFHRFGRFFRDVLLTPNALFLDGTISRLHAPGLDRSDLGFPMGPILGVIAPSD